MIDFSTAWHRAYSLINSSDFVLNLSTEMFGVLLSIPLSVMIAFSLDRASEVRRMRRSLQAVVTDVRHELNYFLDELPDRATPRIDDRHPTFRAYQIMVTASKIANKNIQPAITGARTAHGMKLPDEVRRTLTALSWFWDQIEILARLNLEYTMSADANSDEVTQKVVGHYEEFFKGIVVELSRVEKYSRHSGKNILWDEKISTIKDRYSKIVSLAVEHVKEQRF